MEVDRPRRRRAVRGRPLGPPDPPGAGRVRCRADRRAGLAAPPYRGRAGAGCARPGGDASVLSEVAGEDGDGAGAAVDAGVPGPCAGRSARGGPSPEIDLARERAHPGDLADGVEGPGGGRMSRRVTGPAATLIAIAIGFGWNVTAGATRALAQSPTLERIDRLAGAGRVDEARASLVEWWSSERTSGSRVDEQRGLWLRARLTVDPEQAMLDYRRLVLLYPAGPFTDQALLRLAQAAHALGDDAGARAHVAALVRDHPNGPSRRAAEAWLATAGEPSTPAAVSGAAPGAEPGRAEPRRATGVEPERPPSAPG